MNKNFAIVFSELGARILVGEVDILRGQPGVLIKPDLSDVKGLPPHKWDLKDGKIVKAEDSIIEERERILHGENPPAFSHDSVVEVLKYRFPIVFSLLAFIAGVAASLLLAPLF